MNECVLNFTNGKDDMTSEEGKVFATEVLDYMRELLKEYQEETGNLYNLEATPAEGTTYRFAREDKKQLPQIIQAGTDEAPYYTNSTQIPVGYTDDPFEALELQNEIQCKYTGGTVLHLYMGERLSDAEACKMLVKKVISNYQLPYITISPVLGSAARHIIYLTLPAIADDPLDCTCPTVPLAALLLWWQIVIAQSVSFANLSNSLIT